MTMGMHIVLAGRPNSGFVAYGPFKTLARAVQYAQDFEDYSDYSDGDYNHRIATAVELCEPLSHEAMNADEE